MRALIVLMTVMMLVGCGVSPSRGIPAPELGNGTPASIPDDAGGDGPRSTSALGPGDAFEVRVFEEDSLSGLFRIGGDGYIDYPLCGRVRLAGLDASRAATAIANCLRDGFLRDPQVSILLREQPSRQIFVFGQVNKPGTFEYRDGMTIVEAITRAEGFSKHAAKNSVVVTRVLDGREQRLRVPIEDIGVGRAPNFSLQPGDIVFVPESFF